MASYTFNIPDWHPVSANVLERAWWTRLERKREDAELVRGYALAAGIPKATCRRRVSVTLCYTTGRSWMDPTNAMKSCLDALVTCGLITDDSQAWLELGPWACRRDSSAGTVVTLEDLP